MLKDIIPPLAVGLTEVSIGHPFDTAKVLIQNKKSWWGLPINNYYRGWKFPLCCSCMFNCTVFPTVSYTHLRAHETDQYLVCRLLLEKKKKE